MKKDDEYNDDVYADCSYDSGQYEAPDTEDIEKYISNFGGHKLLSINPEDIPDREHLPCLDIALSLMEMYHKDADELPALFVASGGGLGPDPVVLHVAHAMGSPESKTELATFLNKFVEDNDPSAYLLITEAWAATLPRDKADVEQFVASLNREELEAVKALQEGAAGVADLPKRLRVEMVTINMTQCHPTKRRLFGVKGIKRANDGAIEKSTDILWRKHTSEGASTMRFGSI